MSGLPECERYWTIYKDVCIQYEIARDAQTDSQILNTSLVHCRPIAVSRGKNIWGIDCRRIPALKFGTNRIIEYYWTRM